MSMHLDINLALSVCSIQALAPDYTAQSDTVWTGPLPRECSSAVPLHAGGWGMEYRNLLEGSESLEDMLQRGAIT